MDGFELVKEFFTNMHCSHCQSKFKPDAISLLREENNFFVVKISCTECEQPVGIAIVGIQAKEKQDKSREHMIEENKQPQAPPINFNDVIEAHKFFSSLGPDWTRYINTDIEIELPEDEEE